MVKVRLGRDAERGRYILNKVRFGSHKKEVGKVTQLILTKIN